MPAGPFTLVLGTVLVVVSALAIVARLRLPGWIDRGVGFGVVAASQIELTLFACGGFGHELRPGPLLAVNAAIAAVALALGGRDLLSELRHLPRLRDPVAIVRQNLWAAAITGLALAELVWRTFVAAVLPPYAWDALSYHLTTTAEWIQHGKLIVNPVSLCCANYPLNGELSFVWPGLLLGNDSLVDSVQIGFAALGALAVTGIARTVGCSRAGSAVAGSLYFLTPVILEQSSTNYVDIVFASSFVCGLFFILRFGLARTGRTAYLALAGLTTGIALGAKGLGIPYAGILLAVLGAYLVYLLFRRRIAWPVAAGGLVTFVAALLLTGGYWYARNVIDHGNPIWPFQFQVGPVVLAHGPWQLSSVLSNPSQYHNESNWVRVIRSWVHDATPLRGGSGFYEYEERIGGFGIIWPYLMLPSIAAFVYFAARRRREVLVLLVLPIVAAFLVQPYQWWSRFTMILPALGAVALVHTIERLPRRWAEVARVATLVAVLIGAFLATGTIDPAGKGTIINAFKVVRLATAPSDERTLGALFHPEYRWLDSIPANARVAVELGAEPRFLYPVFGPSFGRAVLPLSATTGPAFSRRLRSLRADYVFVGVHSAFNAFARRDPRLTLVYRDDRVSAYRVSNQATAAANSAPVSRSS